MNPSVKEVASTETADCLVAIDVETRVGEDDPSNEGVDPNPSGQIGVTAAVSAKDTALQVAALTDQVGLLTDMVKTLLSSRDLVTPTSLSASTSPEVLTARQRDIGSSIFSSFEVIDSPSDSPLGHTMPVVGSHLQMSTLDPDKTGSRSVLSQVDRGLLEPHASTVGMG